MVATTEEWYKTPDDAVVDPAGTGLISATTPAASTTVTPPATAGNVVAPTSAGTVSAPVSTTPTAGTGTVTANQTVAGQIDQIIAADSPLMQRAATRADQQMNKRGLMNSSMAVGAGQAAVMDAALPIAQADAQTYAASQTQQNLFKHQTALADLDNSMKAALTNADAQTKAYLVGLDGQIKTTLANIDADYKTLIQASASAGQIYNQTLSEVSKILNNSDMDAATKTNNVSALFGKMETALNFVSSINGVDVTDLLTFTPG